MPSSVTLSPLSFTLAGSMGAALWGPRVNAQANWPKGPIKFIIPAAGALPEMYDVVNDPAETRNIVAEHPALARAMEKELRAWLATEKK